MKMPTSSESEIPEIRVKAAYNGGRMITYISQDITFEQLCDEMRDICKFSSDQLFTMKWIDDEGDPCTLSDEAVLDHAIRVCGINREPELLIHAADISWTEEELSEIGTSNSGQRMSDFPIKILQDVFLMIRRKKLTIFTDCKDSTSILELKKMIEGILKIAPENQQLFKDNQVMEDDKTLQEYGLVPTVAKPQCPAPLGLALRLEPDGDFEPLEITPLSSPPDLPDVMKVPETNGQEQVA